MKGFTLIELLIVVAIIGVLAAVGIPMYNGYVLQAKINTTMVKHKAVVNFYTCSSGPRDYDYFARMMAEDFYQKDWKNPHAVSNNCCFSRRGKIATKSSGLGTIYLNGIHSQKKVIISSNTCDAEPVRVTEVSF